MEPDVVYRVQERAFAYLSMCKNIIFSYTHLLSDYQQCQIFTQLHSTKSAVYMKLYHLV